MPMYRMYVNYHPGSLRIFAVNTPSHIKAMHTTKEDTICIYCPNLIR
jgi:hypothetical protein